VLMGMLGATLTYCTVAQDWPSSALSPSLPSFYTVDLNVLMESRVWVHIVALLLMLMFSISGAMISSARMASLMRPDGGVNGNTSVYLCCGLATILSSTLGSSPVFVSMAASAGIHDGGRTGIVSIVIGIYSLLTSVLLSPLISMIPPCAISPVLLLVGVSMMGEAAHVEWKNIQEALPAFLCAIFQPFTFSVAHGINAGVGTSIVLFFTTGRFLLYMPGLRKRLGLKEVGISSNEDLLLNVAQPSTTFDDQLDPMNTALDNLLDPLNVHNPFTRSVSEPEPSSGVRGKLHTIGLDSRHHAEDLVDQVSMLIGFDKEEVHRVFEERLGTGRNNNFSLYKQQCRLRRDSKRFDTSVFDASKSNISEEVKTQRRLGA